VPLPPLFTFFPARLCQLTLCCCVVEWSAGYGPRYGIVHVDFKTLKRTPKNSAYYLRDTFKARRKAAS
jgi:beta-glucosidase/6-phospho-beta-glucosidase/beta-galactosidase